jgi:hypothetical protein
LAAQPRRTDYDRDLAFAARLLLFLEPQLDTISPALQRPVRVLADLLASRFGLAKLDGNMPGASLHDASVEMYARLAEINVAPFAPMTPDEWESFGVGLPFTHDELMDASSRTAADHVPLDDDRPRRAIAATMHACGAIKGALVESWRRA